MKNSLSFWGNCQEKIAEWLGVSDNELEAKRSEAENFKKDFDRRYLKIFFSGEYDFNDGLLFIYAGAGGVDAQDWASMLLRMYDKYCQQAGFGFVVLDQTVGEQGGTKSAVAEITGDYAYGYLKGEAGVHRLVRISPFSAKSLRHTSFALVDVLPEIDNAEIKIEQSDLRVDTFRSSGPGGQNVNKLETAVRITHLPTGISVAVQSERSQAQNKAKALALLQSKLVQLMEQEKVDELSKLREGVKNKDIEWSNQIRSYVIHPYKMVKDHRTNVETSRIDETLDGDLDEFIKAELQMANKQQKKKSTE